MLTSTQQPPLATLGCSLLQFTKDCLAGDTEALQAANSSYSSDRGRVSWAAKDDMGEESAGKAFAKWLHAFWPAPLVQTSSTRYLSGPKYTAQVSTPRRHSIEVISQCNHIRTHLTPLRLHLRDHFAQLLVAKTQHISTGSDKQSRSNQTIMVKH